ncbi:MAG: ferredoxin domain-containing protein [Candidatus Hermodarchaeota archaeon]
MNEIPPKRKKLIDKAVKDVANLMVAAATTAPKSKGFDDLTIEIVSGVTILQIAKEIKKMRQEDLTSQTFWFLEPDAEAIKESAVIFLIGIHAKRPPLTLDCQACGFETCADYEEAIRQNKTTALCAFKILDLGIALSSATTVAAQHFIDNRMMWSVGMAAQRLDLIKGDIVLGIPLAAKGSNPFFDRYLRFFLQRAREQGKNLNQVLRDQGFNL